MKTKNADGSVTESKSDIRIVYIDEVSPPDANRSLSTNIHPALYDALVARVGELKGKGTLNNRPVLQSGHLALGVREAVAAYSGYAYSTVADLALLKTRESSKTVQARSLVKNLFAGLRAKLDYDSSVGVARGTLGIMGVTLTEQEFADLWDEAAVS